MAITNVTIKQTKKVATSKKLTQRKGKLSIAVKKEESIKIFLKYAVETRGKCYMLSFDTPDRRSCRINDIIAELVKQGYLSQMVPTLKNSVLFLSAYNLTPLNKFIHENFSDLKFVLVRLNRNSYPALKYCY